MVKFYSAARSKGVKPIIGVDAWVSNEADRDKPFRVLLICRDATGYGQLCELLTRAYLTNKHRGRAQMRAEWFDDGAASGLICLSGALDGDVGQALINGNSAQAEQLARALGGALPRRLLHRVATRRRSPARTPMCATRCIWPRSSICRVVATHPIQFLEHGRFQGARGAGVHCRRLCAGRQAAAKALYRRAVFQVAGRDGGAVRRPAGSAGEHGRDRQALQSLNVHAGQELPAAVSDPRGHDARRLSGRRSALPGSKCGSQQLYPEHGGARGTAPERYEARLKIETDTIIADGLPRLLPDRCRLHQLGQAQRRAGRPGAGFRCRFAGGLRAAASPISIRLRYALLFERFLNPERVSMPDFDIDFCQDNRYR